MGRVLSLVVRSKFNTNNLLYYIKKYLLIKKVNF